jgi:ABC-type glycerol-3-phosphate transport system substrate-binding protein
MITSLGFLREIVQRGFAEPEVTSASWEANHQRIAQGNAAMMQIATYYPAQLVDAGLERDSIGMAPFIGTNRTVLFGGGHYGVSNSSDHIEEALDFYEFLYKEGRLGLALGNIPSARNVELPDFPWVDELLSYDPEIIEWSGFAPDFVNVRNEADVSPAQRVQEAVLADDFEGTLEQWDQEWIEARQEVLGES